MNGKQREPKPAQCRFRFPLFPVGKGCLFEGAGTVRINKVLEGNCERVADRSVAQ